MENYKTTRGVYYDLSFSTYTSEVHGYTFYFSSRTYKKKFDETYENDIDKFSLKLRMLLGVKVNQDISIINTYRKIEKRGFRVVSEKGEFKCLDDLALNLSLKISLKELKRY